MKNDPRLEALTREIAAVVNEATSASTSVLSTEAVAQWHLAKLDAAVADARIDAAIEAREEVKQQLAEAQADKFGMVTFPSRRHRLLQTAPLLYARHKPCRGLPEFLVIAAK